MNNIRCMATQFKAPYWRSSQQSENDGFTQWITCLMTEVEIAQNENFTV
jgi:hypothetical protein